MSSNAVKSESRKPSLARRLWARWRSPRSRGTSIVEFTLVLPLLLCMVLALIEFGHLIQARLIVASVSREGGSVASRTDVPDVALANLIATSGRPLNLLGGDGKVIISRVDAGIDASSRNPTLTNQVSAGSLGNTSSVVAGSPNLGLPANLYAHLVFNSTRGSADIAELTMVEVFYKYHPITPLPNFLPGLILPAGLTLQSRAVF